MEVKFLSPKLDDVTKILQITSSLQALQNYIPQKLHHKFVDVNS